MTAVVFFFFFFFFGGGYFISIGCLLLIGCLSAYVLLFCYFSWGAFGNVGMFKGRFVLVICWRFLRFCFGFLLFPSV